MHKFVETCGSGEPWLQISKFLSHLCLVCHGMHQHLPRGGVQYFAGPWFKQCRNILDLVGTIAFLTRLATTPRHVFSQESYELGVVASKGQQHAFARKGEPWVTTNARLGDLNINSLSRVDDRRIKVTAIGLPVWGGEPARSWYKPGISVRGAKVTLGGRTREQGENKHLWWPLKSETSGATTHTTSL